MADHGLQTWDEYGNPMLRITDRITRFIGEFDTGTANGSHADDRLSLGTPFISVRDTKTFDEFSVPPTITYNGQQISWVFSTDQASPRSVRIAYGVY